jgi:hypothetical protein
MEAGAETLPNLGMSARVNTRTTPRMRKAADASIDLIRPDAIGEQTKTPWSKPRGLLSAA